MADSMQEAVCRLGEAARTILASPGDPDDRMARLGAIAFRQGLMVRTDARGRGAWTLVDRRDDRSLTPSGYGFESAHECWLYWHAAGGSVDAEVRLVLDPMLDPGHLVGEDFADALGALGVGGVVPDPDAHRGGS